MRRTALEVLRREGERVAATLPPLLVQAERVASTVAQGVHGRRRVGTGETFWQFRHYGFGDPAHVIDWRQSAKSDHLYVRQTEWEAAQSVWLWRDASPSMAFRSGAGLPEKRERAELLLLALAVLLLRGGEHVALLGSGIPPAAGRAVLNRIVHGLGRAADREPNLPGPELLPRHGHVVLLGDFLSPLEEIDAAVRAFAGRDAQGTLVEILDPAEETLPYRGRTRFEGTEGEGGILIRRAESVRADYAARLAAHREGLAALARSVGWRLVSHRTDAPPERTLLVLYTALSGELGA